MAKEQEQETSAQPRWGTFEELLLASAVNRHGTKSWDSVATELQSRRTSSSLPPSFTPQLCKDKFLDLKRRFISSNDAALVDHLRRIRVQELRTEVQRRDVSIVSLELKVKRLVEEREADLDGRRDKLSPEIVAGKRDSGEVDDRSFNESNSTSQKTATKKDERNDVEGEKKAARLKTEPVEPGGPVRTGDGPGNEERIINGEERGGDDDDDNKKQTTSDVQSSVSLVKKKRRRVSSAGGSSSGEEREADEVSPAKKRASAVKPESFVRLLGIIRSHRLGSAFGRRQRSQESERYKKLIRQHMDLERIESRLENGVYSDCCSPKFYRDLLLLFNNSIVFHRKSSPEHIAAQELRALVIKEMADKLRKQPPKPEQQPTLSVPKPNKSSSIVACSKRSSSVKDLTESSNSASKKEKKVEEKGKANEKKKKVDSKYLGGDRDEKGGVKKKGRTERAVSGGGRRNSLRSTTSGSKSTGDQTKHEYGGNELSSHDAPEFKVDKKENTAMARKRQGAASFLKRMKQNSPRRVPEKDDDDDDDEDDDDDDDNDEDDSSSSEDERRKGTRKEEKGRGKKSDSTVRRVTRSSGGRGAREESGRVKRAVGRPPKRAAAAAADQSSIGKKRSVKVENKEVGGGRARKRSKR